MVEGEEGVQNRELYALLHLSPQASDEEIRKAYRQWASIYHPDKYQDPLMKDTATENFQRICEAYEILSDEYKRQIYDIYGMEGVTAGLELGPKLTKVEEIKEELERLRRLQEEQKGVAHFRPSGVIAANLSLPHFLRGDGLMRGMTMASEVQSVISKKNAIVIGGNLAVRENAGGGAASVLLKHQISPASSVEFVGSLGLQSLLGVHTTRHLSQHCTATMGLTASLNDGSINLSNSWTRQLSEATYGNGKSVYNTLPKLWLEPLRGILGLVLVENFLYSNNLLIHILNHTVKHENPFPNFQIQLSLGPESFISVGWHKKEEKMSASGDIKMGTDSFGATAHYTHQFSSKSHGRISGKIGSRELELEVGGGRKISNFGTVRMLYSIGIQGICWKFELRRSGQKLIVPVLLSRHLNPMLATGAFFVPASLYFLLKKFVVKPYILKVEKQKKLENFGKTMEQVQEARAAAEKAQKLLENVANRKRSRQEETGGLVITKALYGNPKVLRDLSKSGATNEETALQILDVTVPLNFLVNDSGQLKLHEGVKKSGIMGFCDPCPGDPKQLHVEYTYRGNYYEVTVDDYEALQLPLTSNSI